MIVNHVKDGRVQRVNTMTFEITPLSDLEVSARMICEAPLCIGHATHRARYTYTLDGENPRTDEELICDRHVAELREAIARAEQLRTRDG